MANSSRMRQDGVPRGRLAALILSGSRQLRQGISVNCNPGFVQFALAPSESRMDRVNAYSLENPGAYGR